MDYISLYKAYYQYSKEDFEKMYEQRYNSEATIKLFFNIGENQAFLFFPNELNSLLHSIRTIDKRVRNIFDKLPKVAQNQYLKKSMIDEIQFNNSIEGVISTRKDINDIIDDIQVMSNKHIRLKGIVNKYLLLKDLNKINLNSSNDIRKLYDEMLYEEIKQNDPNNLPDGQLFRKDVVHVTTSTGKVIHKGVMPESKIIEWLEEGIKIVNDESLDALIKASLFHYIFSYIHPFYDGNGRINRFISSYILSQNYIPLIGYRLSLTIKENLADYYDAFKHTNDVRNKGDVTHFVFEFLKLILKAYEKTEMYAMEKLVALTKYCLVIDKKLGKSKISEFLYVLTQAEMFSEFGLSINEISLILKCSENTVRNKMKELKAQKLIKEINVSKKIYYSANLENLTE